MDLLNRFLTRATLKQKLTTIIMVVSLVTLLLATGLFILLGGLTFQSNLADLHPFLYKFIGAVCGIYLILALVALALSTRLQRIISRPINDLARTIERISSGQDFSIRAEQNTQDEIGELVQGFNDMLMQLEERDVQLENHRLNLEELVLQRTRELQSNSSRLQQVTRDLREVEQTDHIRSDLLAKLNHEISEPVRDIVGIAAQLSKSALSENDRWMPRHIIKTGETLLNTLNDIVDFPKVETGQIKLRKKPFSMKDLCNEVVTTFTQKTIEKKLTLNCHVDGNCAGTFVGDSFRIKQILYNLVENAIQFTAEGEILLTASCTSDGKVWLAVTDSGIGIPISSQEQISNFFANTEVLNIGLKDNTGCGLAIVRQLTHLMGGTCSLQSTPGKGSTFWIVLDLTDADQDVTDPTRASFATGELTPFYRPHILLAEDNQTTQKLMKLILDKTDCQLDILDNGLMAIEAMASARYDLVFMDFEMPMMNGIEATRTVREKDNKTPIIALTAHVRDEEIALCFAAGMNDYLTKPFRQQQLLDMIEKWCPRFTGTQTSVETAKKNASKVLAVDS